MKTRAFIKYYPFFYKIPVIVIYKKLNTLEQYFIKNPIFGKNIHPCSQLLLFKRGLLFKGTSPVLLSDHDCLSDCKASRPARNLMHLIQLKILFYHFSVLVILERFFLVFLLNYNSNCGKKFPCDNQTLIYTDLWKGKPFDMLYTQSIHYTGSQSPAITPLFLISFPISTLHMT